MKNPNTITREVLADTVVVKALATAIAEGRHAGVEVSVAIVGPSLELLGFARADGATPHSGESSRRKAQTSASTRRATGWMTGALAVELPLATGSLLTNLPGGAAIRFGGVVVGGIGIAGGTVDQDATIVTAVINAIGAEAA